MSIVHLSKEEEESEIRSPFPRETLTFTALVWNVTWQRRLVSEALLKATTWPSVSIQSYSHFVFIFLFSANSVFFFLNQIILFLLILKPWTSCFFLFPRPCTFFLQYFISHRQCIHFVSLNKFIAKTEEITNCKHSTFFQLTCLPFILLVWRFHEKKSHKKTIWGAGRQPRVVCFRFLIETWNI